MLLYCIVMNPPSDWWRCRIVFIVRRAARANNKIQQQIIFSNKCVMKVVEMRPRASSRPCSIQLISITQKEGKFASSNKTTHISTSLTTTFIMLLHLGQPNLLLTSSLRSSANKIPFFASSLRSSAKKHLVDLGAIKYHFTGS